MQEKIDSLKRTWSDKKKRKKLILTVLVVILFLTALYRLLAPAEEKLPEGSLRVVVCTRCLYKDVRRIKDIKDPKYKCCKCGGPLAKCRKCSECDYEYPYTENSISDAGLTKAQLFRRLAELKKCPKCGSTRTYVLSPAKLKKKKRKTP